MVIDQPNESGRSGREGVTSDNTAAPAAEFELERFELEVRRAEAEAKLEEITRSKTRGWWQSNQVALLLVGGILTLMGNIGLAYYNGITSRDQEQIRAVNALNIEREKAKANLILQAIASDDPANAQRNILFFIDSGFIADKENRISAAALRYLPVLPSPGGPSRTNPIHPSDYGSLFWSVSLAPNNVGAVDAAVDRIVDARTRLEAVAESVNSPWYVIGVVWFLETGGSFSSHLHNGDSLEDRTVRSPIGRPVTGSPPFEWEESAIDAIHLRRLDNLNGQPIEVILDMIERANGLGYRERGTYSPYLWGHTSAYTGGRYVGDGVFDPDANSPHMGAVALLRRLHERDFIEFVTSDADTAGIPTNN